MLTLAAGMFACMVVTILVSISINNRAIERARTVQEQAEERERAAVAETRRITCSQMIIIRDEYREQADTISPAGRKIGEAWAYLASIHCQG